MAIYFKLLDKSTNEAISLSKIDEQICRDVLKCEPDEKLYGGRKFPWFDIIGYALAEGHTLEEGENSVMQRYAHAMWDKERAIIKSIVDYLLPRYNVQNGFTR